MDTAPDNLLTQWARVLIGSLYAAGIRRVVLSPGSRSTPLVAAVLREPRLQTWIIIDERSAGFFALAQAKVSAEPTLLVCTSGSAPAHYFPAVIEADETRTPLLVLSADRPRRLQANRSAQTIDQTELFGRKVRAFFELGDPRPERGALQALARKAVQAVALSRGPEPGPVHLNFPADKPLEPLAASTAQQLALEQAASDILQQLVRCSSPELALADEEATIVEILSFARGAQRPVLSFGPSSPGHAARLAAYRELCTTSGWPVLAEASSGLRFGPHVGASTMWDGFDLSFRQPRHLDALPDFVLHFGDPFTSGAAHSAIGRAEGLRRVVVSQHAFADPHNDAALVLRAPQAAVARALSERLPEVSEQWLLTVTQANAESWQRVTTTLASDAPFHEGHALAVIGEQLTTDDTLVLGNSLPLRMADTVIAAKEDRVHCVSQRGANGIDGLVSGAAGVASVSAGRTLAVIGDISALHDLGALAVVSQLERALTVVIINNGGGRIFEQLPIANSGDPAVSLSPWTTPHQIDIARAADAFGIRSMQVGSAGELRLALDIARQHAAPCWIEVNVAEHGARMFYEDLTRPSPEPGA